jgi:O-antigen/teichoic acid export membrane protein
MMLKGPFNISLFPITNVKALQVFQILRQGGTILIAILLAKSPLPLKGIGHYEMLFFIAYAFTAFWITGLVQGFLARYPQMEEQEKAGFLGGIYLFFVAIATAVFAILWLFDEPILQFLVGQKELPHYGLFLAFLWVNIPTFLVENFYLVLKRPREILSFGLLSFLLQTIGVLAPIFMGYGLEWAFWGLLIGASFKHAWLWVLLYRSAHLKWDNKLILPWAYSSIPLILYSLIGGFHQSFDNWLVNFFSNGDEQVFAIFRYGARELPLALALSGAFGTALLPEVAADLPSGLQKIKEKSRKLFHLLFPFSIVLVLSSHWLFPIVFSDAFAESVLIFNIFLLITISRLLFSRTVLIGLNENKVILYISLLELPINALLSLLLVNSLGLAGIALGTVIAFSFEKLGLCWYLYKKYRIRLKQYTDLNWFIGYTSILLVCFVLSLYFSP